MIEDIFQSLEKELQKKPVQHAIKRAFWRGVQNHKDNPKATENLRLDELSKQINKSNE